MAAVPPTNNKLAEQRNIEEDNSLFIKKENKNDEEFSQFSSKRREVKETRKNLEEDHEDNQAPIIESLSAQKMWSIHNCEIVAYWEISNQLMWNLCQDEIWLSQPILDIVPLCTGANRCLRKVKNIYDKVNDFSIDEWIIMWDQDIKQVLSNKISSYYDNLIDKI